MGNILLTIEKQIGNIVKSVGIPKKKFDQAVTTSGWIILAYVIIRNINKGASEGA